MAVGRQPRPEAPRRGRAGRRRRPAQPGDVDGRGMGPGARARPGQPPARPHAARAGGRQAGAGALLGAPRRGTAAGDGRRARAVAGRRGGAPPPWGPSARGGGGGPGGSRGGGGGPPAGGRGANPAMPAGLVSAAFRRRSRPGGLLARAVTATSADQAVVTSRMTEAYGDAPTRMLAYATLTLPAGMDLSEAEVAVGGALPARRSVRPIAPPPR